MRLPGQSNKPDNPDRRIILQITIKASKKGAEAP
jgi:hypothetical protein